MALEPAAIGIGLRNGGQSKFTRICHQFAAKGLRGCLNTSASVGSVFAVPFVVFDPAGVPAVAAMAVRSVALVGTPPLWISRTLFQTPVDL